MWDGIQSVESDTTVPVKILKNDLPDYLQYGESKQVDIPD